MIKRNQILIGNKMDEVTETNVNSRISFCNPISIIKTFDIDETSTQSESENGNHDEANNDLVIKKLEASESDGITDSDGNSSVAGETENSNSQIITNVHPPLCYGKLKPFEVHKKCGAFGYYLVQQKNEKLNLVTTDEFFFGTYSNSLNRHILPGDEFSIGERRCNALFWSVNAYDSQTMFFTADKFHEADVAAIKVEKDFPSTIINNKHFVLCKKQTEVESVDILQSRINKVLALLNVMMDQKEVFFTSTTAIQPPTKPAETSPEFSTTLRSSQMLQNQREKQKLKEAKDLAEKVRLEELKEKKRLAAEEKAAQKAQAEKEKAEKEKAEKEKAEKEKAEKEKAAKEKAEREKAEKEKAEQEKAGKKERKTTNKSKSSDEQNKALLTVEKHKKQKTVKATPKKILVKAVPVRASPRLAKAIPTNVDVEDDEEEDDEEEEDQEVDEEEEEELCEVSAGTKTAADRMRVYRDKQKKAQQAERDELQLKIHQQEVDLYSKTEQIQQLSATIQEIASKHAYLEAALKNATSNQNSATSALSSSTSPDTPLTQTLDVNEITSSLTSGLLKNLGPVVNQWLLNNRHDSPPHSSTNHTTSNDVMALPSTTQALSSQVNNSSQPLSVPPIPYMAPPMQYSYPPQPSQYNPPYYAPPYYAPAPYSHQHYTPSYTVQPSCYSLPPVPLLPGQPPSSIMGHQVPSQVYNIYQR